MTSDLSITRLSGSLGAEVRGVSLKQPASDLIEQITEALLEHLVLFFPEQHLSPEQHVAFGRHFGTLEAHPNLNNPFTKDYPEIFELAASHGGLADEWHSDITFEKHPSIMSILNMIQAPAVGGDTMWASAYAAYEALSAPLRDMCDGLTALHDAAPHGRRDMTYIHPVVRVHPVTGRKCLFVNEHFTRRIVELSHQESEHLLAYLIRWVATPRFTVRYRWQAGTVAMWDNRCTQHFVLSDFDEQRIIQRVTIVGDTPEGAVSPRWSPYVRTENVGATSRYDNQLQKALGKRAATLEDNAKASSGA
ncbi:MAG: TauD/TfdA dioxygenase family protein [Burkholderiaceae bacterium]